jgi:hypothetical protein
VTRTVASPGRRATKGGTVDTDEKRCPRCAEVIKRAALVCKHCGHEFSTEELAAQKAEDVKSAKTARGGCLAMLGIAVLALIAALNWHHGGSKRSSGDGSEASATVADASTEPVKSCDFNEMLSRLDGIPTVGGLDASKLCQEWVDQYGGFPQTRVIRALAKAVSMIETTGAEGDDVKIGSRLIRIAKARGQSDPDAIIRTFDLVTRTAEATHGQVAPDDVFKFLKTSGDMAHTLSDDGLTNMLVLVWEQKKQE